MRENDDSHSQSEMVLLIMCVCLCLIHLDKLAESEAIRTLACEVFPPLPPGLQPLNSTSKCRAKAQHNAV